MSDADQDAPQCQPPGGTLGRVGPFQLLERMPGKGEVAEFLARQHGPAGFERVCTLKLAARAPREVDRRANEAVAREAKLLMRLDHPAIVRFYDFVEKDSHLILVLESFSRLSLDHFLKLVRKQQRVLDERIVWHIGCALFGALAHAHGLVDAGGNAAPIVHRDVRPENVLIAADGRVRLTGFSYAQDREPDEATACGLAPDGPTFVAPELLRGAEASELSDAFSAALIIWELLTGRCATPEGLSEFDLLKALSQRQVDSLRALRADLPPLVTTALDICLSLDPEQRTIGCLEVEGCMRAAIGATDGAEPIRHAIVELGPNIEKLAGGPAAPSTSARQRTATATGLDPKHSVTISGHVHLSAQLEGMVTAVPGVRAHPTFEAPTQAVDLLSERSSLASLDSLDLTLPRPAMKTDSSPRVPASDLISSAPPPDAAPSPATDTDTDTDTDVLAWRQRRDRQRFVRRALLAVAPVLVVAGLLLALQSNWRRQPSAPQQVVFSAPPEPKPVVASHASVASTPVPSATPSDAIAPTSQPIPSDRALLVVSAPPSGHVFVQGKALGRTGEPLLTPCGQRYVRVGSNSGAQGLENVAWLARGQSVALRCGDRTEVPADPSSNRP